ncbi:TPA: hypothetical protein MJD06_28475 [Klebsiella pneumoniae]|uniref:Uncharacterized protein n=1 Tax=Klebsiella pneumoniae TaxID=573 RepID=A0A483GXS0_KLEPN|nr:hypothetical protein [Klebsiella pneumoniae]HBZ0991619.1 hypothetical protein [Klebsiella pneumoniae]
MESPLSPYHFFTPGVTTQATALATPLCCYRALPLFLVYFRARIAVVQPLSACEFFIFMWVIRDNSHINSHDNALFYH